MTTLAALPTVQFVIGLREGVEAALIVGIIATFLHQQGRRDALRWMWMGVGLAVSICVVVAIVLNVVDDNLPQKEQEAFEGIIGLVAVAMVTWMVIWMGRHSRELSSDLRASAGRALAEGSAIGLIAMAFLSVMREGLETTVFLISTFQSSYGVSPASAAGGTIVGLLVASVIGYAIYRGGRRINLSRFFGVTAVLLVVIAAGLVSTAVLHLNEAGIITGMQGRFADLSGFVTPDGGSILNGLVTGLLGIYPYPTDAQALGYVLYLVPMLLLLAYGWLSRRGAPGGAPAPAATAPGTQASSGPASSAVSGGPAVEAETRRPDPTPSS